MPTPVGLSATAGSKIYIGGVLAISATPFVEDDFAGMSWINISWVDNMGTFGDKAQDISFIAVDVQRTIKLKGSFDAGNLTLSCGIDYEDEGQSLCLAGLETPYDYAFQVLFNDMPSGGTSGSTRYFIAKITSMVEQLEAANNVMKRQIILGIDSNIVAVNAY